MIHRSKFELHYYRGAEVGLWKLLEVYEGIPTFVRCRRALYCPRTNARWDVLSATAAGVAYLCGGPKELRRI